MTTTVNPQDASKIAQLQRNIKRMNRLPNMSQQNYMFRARDYIQLAKLTKNKSYVDQAIQSYTKSIQMNPNPSLIGERAKAYISIGMSDKAVDDFRYAQQIISKGGCQDMLQNYHNNQMMKEIAKLDQVKSVINKMRAENKLPGQFLTAFQDLTNTTQRLVMKVGVHQGRLNEHDDLISKLSSKIQMLEKGLDGKADAQKLADYQQQMKKYNDLFKNFEQKIGSNKDPNSYQQAIKELQQKIKGIQGNVKKVQTRVQQVQVKLDKLVHHNQNQFNKIKTQFKKVNGTIEGFKGKFKFIQGQVNSVNHKIIYIDQQLKKGLYPKNQVKDQMDKWKKQQPEIYQYANNFYWVLNNYLLSYRVASTGMFDGKQPNPSLFQSFFPTCLNAITNALSLVPIVGQAVDLLKTIVQTVFDEYKSRKFDLTVKKMNALIKYDSQEDLSLAVGKGVIQLCKMQYKAKQIKELKNIKTTSLDRNPFVEAKQQFDKEIQDIIKKVNNFKINEQSQIYGLVIQDVSALIGYILRQEISQQNPIQNAIIEGFKGGQNSPIGKSLTDRYGKNRAPQTVQTAACCLIYSIHHIKYDNEILNYPHLFKYLQQKIGYKKAIQLGKNIDKSLIQQANQTQNLQIIEAGILSLNYQL